MFHSRMNFPAMVLQRCGHIVLEYCFMQLLVELLLKAYERCDNEQIIMTFVFEFQLTIVMPLMTGPVLFGSHVVSVMVWLIFAVLYGSTMHCGYNLPFLPSGEYHYYHHLK